MVCVGVAEDTSGCSLDHQIHRLQHWHLGADAGQFKGERKNIKIKIQFVSERPFQISTSVWVCVVF